MSNMEKVRNLTYKVEEYEKQKKELQERFEIVRKTDRHKFTLFLYGGCSDDLQVTLSDSSADHVVKSWCEWCDRQIEDIKDEIRNCLTSSEECDTLKSHS